MAPCEAGSKTEILRTCPVPREHPQSVSARGVYAQPPATERALPGWSQEIPRKLGYFVTEKQPTSIAIGWSEPVCGRELHPLKASDFEGALSGQLCHRFADSGAKWGVDWSLPL
jgi:hypothetical protein